MIKFRNDLLKIFEATYQVLIENSEIYSGNVTLEDSVDLPDDKIKYIIKRTWIVFLL